MGVRTCSSPNGQGGICGQPFRNQTIGYWCPICDTPTCTACHKPITNPTDPKCAHCGAIWSA